MNVALRPRSRQSNDTNSNTKNNSNTSKNTNTSTTKVRKQVKVISFDSASHSLSVLAAKE